jgi:hypothetical protein
MSSIVVTASNSGTGTVSLVAPVTNTNRTITLPDATGTDQTVDGVLTQFNATGSAPVYACRAWVNFNGTGTVSIRASGNVSSITDNGVGNYRVNFATAMPDANYCVTYMNEIGRAGLYTTTTFQFQSLNDAGSGTDVSAANVAIFR